MRCNHDGIHYSVQTPDKFNTKNTTVTTCGNCKTLLYTKIDHFAEDVFKVILTVEDTVEDPVYGLLYTHEGRRSLHNFAIKFLGLEKPKCWTPTDPFYDQVVQELYEEQQQQQKGI
jgi:hypothetical protein